MLNELTVTIDDAVAELQAGMNACALPSESMNGSSRYVFVPGITTRTRVGAADAWLHQFDQVNDTYAFCLGANVTEPWDPWLIWPVPKNPDPEPR